MSPADFDYVRNFVRDEAAIVLEPGKEYLVQSRLVSVTRKNGFATLGDLVSRLRANPRDTLHREVIDAMTTNETSFFRDLHPFDALRQKLLPELITRRGGERQINFWCGAASTGQEPYSVMMLLAEHFPDLLKWNLKFIASDLSSEVLARARAGRYNQMEINRGLPAKMLVKYFTMHGAEWQISPALRDRIDFREMNLVKDWPAFPPLDIIFLRNVLIYFDVETKKAIFARIRRVLRPGGYLLLGGAESTSNVDDAFVRVAGLPTPCFQLKPA